MSGIRRRIAVDIEIRQHIDYPALMETERNLGSQPIAAIMERHGLKPHDLVEASTDQLTHKMVQRAVKGRRLTPKTKRKVIAAMVQAAGQSYLEADLFNY